MYYPHDLCCHSKEKFLQTFAGLYEHSPWIVERALDSVLGSPDFNDISKFHRLLCNIVLRAEEQLQMDLIFAHPRLAGKQAQQNELTAFSSQEQKSAGLNACSEKQLQSFSALNEEYFSRFGFDFIMAVKGKTVTHILHIFERRLENSVAQEKANALSEINKIAEFRMQSLYEGSAC